jgi:hypothetical protein
MLNFKRAKSLPANTVSGMNKGVIFTTPNSTTGITCYCLTPIGSEQQVSVNIPANTTYFFPVYTSKWTSSTAGVSAFEVN